MRRTGTWIGIGLLVAAAGLAAACGGQGAAPAPMATTQGPNPHPAGSKFQIPPGMDGVPAIQVESLAAGAGAQPAQGQFVRLHYSGLAQGQTRPYNDTRAKQAPVEIAAGLGGIQPGIDALVLQMRVGDRWKATIAPQLMFGANGGPNLPPNSTVVVDVELLEIVQ